MVNDTDVNGGGENTFMILGSRLDQLIAYESRNLAIVGGNWSGAIGLAMDGFYRVDGATHPDLGKSYFQSEFRIWAFHKIEAE